MSQSSNSPSKMNIFSQLSSTTVDTNINSNQIICSVKRRPSEELNNEKKKVMIDHHSNEKEDASVVAKSFDQSKFVNACSMTGSASTNTHTIPDMSDEEFLAYAIEFEKNNPQ